MYVLSSSVMIPPWEDVPMPFRSPSLLLVAVTDNCRIYPIAGRQTNVGRTHGVGVWERIAANGHFSHKILFVVNLLKLILLQNVSLCTVYCVLKCLCFRNVPIATDNLCNVITGWSTLPPTFPLARRLDHVAATCAGYVEAGCTELMSQK
jgi:hypothetical protein